MGKSDTTNAPKGDKLRFTMSGSITKGWQIFDEETPVPLHFTNMWDAMLVRLKLNSGEWKLAKLFCEPTF